jgi:hypothetical protein
VFRDRLDGLWQSGLLKEDGNPKPALEPFAEVTQELDGRNPVLPESVEVARVPALELAYYVPPGTPLGVTVDGAQKPAVPLEADGWLEVPVGDSVRYPVNVRVTDPHGHSVSRTVQLLDAETIQVD